MRKAILFYGLTMMTLVLFFCNCDSGFQPISNSTQQSTQVPDGVGESQKIRLLYKASDNSVRAANVPYQVTSTGDIVVLGDVLVGKESALQNSQTFSLDATIDVLKSGGATISSARNPANMLWPNNTVPYSISTMFSDQERQIIQNSINILNQEFSVAQRGIGLRMVPFDSAMHSEQVKIDKSPADNACNSYVGYYDGLDTELFLGSQCMMGQVNGAGVSGVILHELLHAFGFQHEHSREDSPTYITRDFSHFDIQPGDSPDVVNTKNFYRDSFAILPGVVGLMNGYDYESITHYGSFILSPINNQNYQIFAKANCNPATQDCTISNSAELSEGDYEGLRQLYPMSNPGNFGNGKGDDSGMATGDFQSCEIFANGSIQELNNRVVKGVTANINGFGFIEFEDGGSGVSCVYGLMPPEDNGALPDIPQGFVPTCGDYQVGQSFPYKVIGLSAPVVRDVKHPQEVWGWIDFQTVNETYYGISCRN